MTCKKLFKSLSLVVVCAASAGFAAYYVCSRYPFVNDAGVSSSQSFAPLLSGASLSGVATQSVDLTEAAEKTIHGVVHIKATVNAKTRVVEEMPDIFDYIFGGQQPRQRQYQSRPQVGYGSGVILTSDGYIVTNNHVIEDADEIEVNLNDNRTFLATVVGADPTTDLALIKIEGDEFPVIPMGNSDDLKIGEWVLAVGNPFNLTSTVTAGVVSAKARKLGIYDAKESIESFIQTDAAINMGNSGGALVNTRGELVGINSALESPTGTYAGYGFAIPTTIVRKVVADLKEYGTVQRALLGISGGNLSDIRQLDENKNKDFGALDGVYVSDVMDGGGALAAGLQSGDIIVSVNDRKIKTMAELQEMITQYRPGDKVSVTYLRDKKEKKTSVTLMNSKGNTEVVKNSDMGVLGAEFAEVPDQLKRQLNIGYGIQVADVTRGAMQKAGIQRGYIILKINGTQVKEEADVRNAYEAAVKSPEQVLFITGIYPSGRRANYAVDISE